MSRVSALVDARQQVPEGEGGDGARRLYGEQHLSEAQLGAWAAQAEDEVHQVVVLAPVQQPAGWVQSRQAVAGARHNFGQLRQAVHKVEHLGGEQQQQRLRVVPQNALA